jgi:hypothetical protein
MFSTAWKVEDIFPGWTRAKLEDWGASDPKFIEMSAALTAFELGNALGFSNNEEEMRRAEQFFMEMFLKKQHRNELLRGEAAAPKKAVRGAAAPGGAARDGAASGKAARDGVAPGKAARGKAAPGKAARGKAAPGKAARGKAAPGKAARGKAASRGAAGSRAAPKDGSARTSCPRGNSP